VGFHVSIADGLPEAVDHALARGCTAFQVFCGNPRAWAFSERGEDESRCFRARRAESGLAPLVVHACYLANPCSCDAGVRARSVGRLAAELRVAAALGADHYVLHPGSHKGRSLSWGVARAVDTLGEALRRAGAAPVLLLENTASPHGPGGTPAALGALIGALGASAAAPQIGLALDSCHAFGAGYDLREPPEVDRLVRDLDDEIGLGRLELLHVNDSRDEPGSHRDRHEHIGRGMIGRAGLGNLLNHPALRGLPLILETPWESVEVDRWNLEAVLQLLEGA
jgi:deoxyribonuclease-4